MELLSVTSNQINDNAFTITDNKMCVCWDNHMMISKGRDKRCIRHEPRLHPGVENVVVRSKTSRLVVCCSQDDRSHGMINYLFILL